VAGIAGFVCGPAAAALITFVNLRRLNQRRKAVWTLILTLVACVAFGLAVAKVSDDVITPIAKLIGNVVSPFLYPLLQSRAYGEWERSHPGAAYDSGWRSSGWAILGLVTFLVLAMGSAVAFSWNEQAQDIEVRYDLPESIGVDEPFVFTIGVENKADRPQLLYSIDIEKSFLDGIFIQRSEPPFVRTEPNMLTSVTSYVFRRNIPAKGTLEIELAGKARKAGRFPLRVDVCVKTSVKCSTFELDPIVVK
jgi:hypothetical protein